MSTISDKKQWRDMPKDKTSLRGAKRDKWRERERERRERKKKKKGREKAREREELSRP
jgi:hypothetical protein